MTIREVWKFHYKISAKQHCSPSTDYPCLCIKVIWSGIYSKKMKFFICEFVHLAFNTTDRLQCKFPSMAHTHNRLQCNFAQIFWNYLTSVFNWKLALPKDPHTLLSPPVLGHPFKDDGKSSAESDLGIFWSVWIKRNHRTFVSKEKTFSLL